MLTGYHRLTRNRNGFYYRKIHSMFMTTNDVKTWIYLEDIQIIKTAFWVNFKGLKFFCVFRNQFLEFWKFKMDFGQKNGTFLSMLTWHFQIPIRIDSKSPLKITCPMCQMFNSYMWHCHSLTNSTTVIRGILVRAVSHIPWVYWYK